jgi:hypothetical protein
VMSSFRSGQAPRCAKCARWRRFDRLRCRFAQSGTVIGWTGPLPGTRHGRSRHPAQFRVRSVVNGRNLGAPSCAWPYPPCCGGSGIGACCDPSSPRQARRRLSFRGGPPFCAVVLAANGSRPRRSRASFVSSFCGRTSSLFLLQQCPRLRGG